MISFLLLIFMTGTAWGASTATCPSVENGAWIDDTGSGHEELAQSQEYTWGLTTWTVTVETWENHKIIDLRHYYLWCKVPYKIDWIGCPMVSYVDHYTPSQGWVPSVMIGLREDGVVVWKKK